MEHPEQIQNEQNQPNEHVGELDDQTVELLAKLFRGFGDPTRLQIVLTLTKGAYSVSEIVNALGISQPNASSHLQCLRGCNLAVAKREGRSKIYNASSKKIAQLINLALSILQETDEGIAGCPNYDETVH